MKQFLIEMSHRSCRSEQKKLRQDLIAMNAEKAQMARQIVELIREIDQLKGKE